MQIAPRRLPPLIDIELCRLSLFCKHSNPKMFQDICSRIYQLYYFLKWTIMPWRNALRKQSTRKMMRGVITRACQDDPIFKGTLDTELAQQFHLHMLLARSLGSFICGHIYSAQSSGRLGCRTWLWLNCAVSSRAIYVLFVLFNAYCVPKYCCAKWHQRLAVGQWMWCCKGTQGGMGERKVSLISACACVCACLTNDHSGPDTTPFVIILSCPCLICTKTVQLFKNHQKPNKFFDGTKYFLGSYSHFKT